MISLELLSSLDLIKAQALCIYKLKKDVIAYEDKILMLTVF